MFKKLKSLFHNDWCKNCLTEYTLIKKTLYSLPEMVGHYVSHQNASYYINNLTKVNKKSEIPIGFYACGIKEFTCKNCGKKAVLLEIFLPVREEEKFEEFILFENGELDNFLKNN